MSLPPADTPRYFYERKMGLTMPPEESQSTILSSYLSRTLGLQATTDKLTAPVNEGYSSGNEPWAETLQSLWTTLLLASKDYPLNSPEQSALVTLAGELKSVPSPASPCGGTSQIQIREDDGCPTKPWLTLFRFNMAIMVLWDDALSVKHAPRSEWTNHFSFLARLTKEGILTEPFERAGISLARQALQTEREDVEMLDKFVARAGVWMVVLAEEVWGFLVAGVERGEEEEGELARVWELWMTRFLFMSHREDLSVQTRELASEAEAVMQRVT